MDIRNYTFLALALIALATSATHTCAQPIYTPYAFTNHAGNPPKVGSVDGTGSVARFFFPEGVAVDVNGNVYVTDSQNNLIRMIKPDGATTTLAGSVLGGYQDGIGSEAKFYRPYGVAVDNLGIVYVVDTFNHVVRKLTPDGTNWVVTTLAGLAHAQGTADGTGSNARFSWPIGAAVDSTGNVYVADRDNFKVRKITPAGEVTSIAGGTNGFADGTGSAARFREPCGIVLDGAGNLYVTDSYNKAIRKLTPEGTNWVVTTLSPKSGEVNNYSFVYPEGIAVDSAGYVYVADTFNNRIVKISPAGVITRLAGTGSGQPKDGIGAGAQFNQPEGIALDNVGNLYVADAGNNRITKGIPVLAFDNSPGSLSVSNGFYQMRIVGPFESNVVVEASADLVAWMPFQTNALSPAGLDMSVPLDTNPNRFFRAHLSP